MIQEPISDLQKILGEPVEEVTGIYPALPDPAGNFSRDGHDCKNAAGRTPCLRPRLTVRLVALEQDDSGNAPVSAHEVPARVLIPASFVDHDKAVFAGPYTPEPDANIPTPEPGGNEYAGDDEYDNRDTGEFYPYLDTPAPEPNANRSPYTPAPDHGEWFYQETSERHTNRLSILDPVQPILLPMKSEVVESVSMGLTLTHTHASKLPLRFDPALTMLTFLLLLGILGGIGFGYLLTIVYQG